MALEAPTAWDVEMAKLLKPLVDLEMNHPVLFYANTFPIAFHYAYALGEQPEEMLSKRLNSGTWNVPPAGSKASFYYGTVANKKLEVPVTKFTPKYVFAYKTLAVAHAFDKAIETQRLAQRLDRKNPSFDEFLEVALPKYDKVILHTEIEELGKSLSAMIGSRKPVTLYTPAKGEHLPLTKPFANSAASTMRLFVYGGPLSTYLLRKDNYYVGLLLGGANEGITTAVRIKGISSVSDRAKAKQAIAAYHRKLFADAETLCKSKGRSSADKCPPFYSVYRAYNELAWTLQHRSSFKSAKEYAQCLFDHHVTPTHGGNAKKRAS